MSDPVAPQPSPAPEEPGVHEIPELEEDQNVAPRPEEEIADIARQVPDVEDHADDD